MQHAKSESNVTSLAPSSPSRSPKRHAYYVQSPSRDSHDGDKSLSIHPSPMESPSHHSYGRHSRNSSESRFSGILPSSGPKGGGGRRSNDKGWPECDVIMEEGKYDDIDDDKKWTRRCQGLMAVGGFILIFTVFCLIIWGAGRNFKAQVTVKSLSVSNLYIGSGADFTGVPTNMLNFNGTVRIIIYNPATFYGIHVSSTPVNLLYSDVVVATGQLERYSQPRKSHRTVLVHMEGTKVPLYGAGLSLHVLSDNAVQLPLKLDFSIRSRGDIVGKLVRTKHGEHVSCPVKIDSTSSKIIEFKKNSCNYS